MDATRGSSQREIGKPEPLDGLDVAEAIDFHPGSVAKL